MSLFRNPKTAVKLIALFLVVCVAAWATTCSAEAYSSFGGGKTVNRGDTETMELSRVWPVAYAKDAQWRIGMTLIGESSDSRYQLDVPNNACVFGQYLDGFKNFKVGIGAALCQNKEVYISAHGQFRLSMEYHFKHFYLVYGHYSNAGTVMPNSGRDFINVMWKFN